MPRWNLSMIKHYIALILSAIAVVRDAEGDVTWLDNEHGNVISFDGDQGWKIYECQGTNSNGPEDGCDQMIPHCEETEDCRRVDTSGHAFYGPFNNALADSKWIMRRFSCEGASDVTLSFKVSSCNADGVNNEDDVTVWIYDTAGAGFKLGKYTIDSSQGIILDDDGTLAESDCTAFFTQTIAPETPVTVAGLSTFKVELRHRNLDSAQAYFHDFELTCSPETTNDIPSGVVGVTTSDDYCVSGFTGDQAHLNGEYSLKIDAYEQPGQDVNGNRYFQKHDLNGESYLYLLPSGDDGEGQWVIGEELNGDEFHFQCAEMSSESDFTKVASLDCNSHVVLEEQECEDHHTKISNILGVSVEHTAVEVADYAWKHPLNMAMMVLFVSVFICMCFVTCFMCMKMRRREPYGKMVKFEEDESDCTDISDDEQLSAI